MNPVETSPRTKGAAKRPARDSRGSAAAASGGAVASEPGESAEAAPVPTSWRDHLVPGLVVLGVLVIDHLTKWWAIAKLRPPDWPSPNGPIIVIIPGLLDLRYAQNTGAAFSIFANHPIVLTLVSVAIAAVIFWWYWRTPREHRGTRIALALVLGGAVGNLVDRLFRGSVVDFIDAYWRTHHWPTFNVADSAICVGIGLLILWSFLEQKSH